MGHITKETIAMMRRAVDAGQAPPLTLWEYTQLAFLAEKQIATQPTASNAGERELRFLTQKELDSIGRHAEGMDGQQWDRWVQEKFAEVNNLKVQGAAYGY